MWGLLNAVAAPVKSAAYQFARNQAAGAARNAGLNTVRALRRSPINSPAERLAALKLTANVPVLRQGAGALGGVTAVDVSNRTGFTGQIEGALNQVGPAIDRFFSGTPQAIQQFGREQEKKGWGGALELAAPLGFLAAPFIPNTAAAKPRMPGLPADYKQTELAAGAAAERFRPGAGFPGQQAAAERAYQQEKARVSQLTAQDPELQRYEKARAGAKTQEEMNTARDIGMQIWQQKYGNTPMGQPGGAVGMRNPLMDRTFGYQTGGASDQQMGAPTLGPSPLVPQVDQSLNPASPNYIGGEGAPLMDFTRDEVTPELIAAYQKQLLEQAAAGRK